MPQTFYERMQSRQTPPAQDEYGKQATAEWVSEACYEIHEPQKRINIQRFSLGFFAFLVLFFAAAAAVVLQARHECGKKHGIS